MWHIIIAALFIGGTQAGPLASHNESLAEPPNCTVLPLPTKKIGALPLQPSTIWGLLGGIISGGVIVIALLVSLFVRRRRN